MVSGRKTDPVGGTAELCQLILGRQKTRGYNAISRGWGRFRESKKSDPTLLKKHLAATITHIQLFID